MNSTALERSVRQARRRLFYQSLLNRLVACWTVALAAAVAWFLAQPVLVADAPSWLRWAVLGGLLGVGAVTAVVWAVRTFPSRLTAALSLDQRFDLCERATTALSLTPGDVSSPAGQALLADVNQRAEKLDVRSRFPLRLGRRSLLIPVQALGIALLAMFYQPVLSSSNASSGNGDGKKDAARIDPNDPAAQAANPRPPIRKPVDRQNKSEELKQLEQELDKLYAEANKNDAEQKPEQVREKIEQVARAEERLRKAEQEKAEKFQRLQEQMQKLGAMERQELSQDGPAREFNDALARGDLDKAKEEVDRLRKKAKDKKLSEEDAQKLKRQMEQMADRLERLARNEEQKKKLQDLIDKARKENRDAEALERELKRLEQESKEMKQLQDLARKLGDCKKCLDAKDMEGLAEQLGEVAKELDGMIEQIEDLEDLDEHLQNLKEMKKRLCKH